MSWKTEFWETLSPQADKEVGNIFRKLVEGKYSAKKAFVHLSLIPYEFKDAELAKETVNKFIDHAVENTSLSEDELVEIYQTEDMNCGLAKWAWDVAYSGQTNSFEAFWESVKENYSDEFKVVAEGVWKEVMNNDTLWANDFADYWKHTHGIPKF